MLAHVPGPVRQSQTPSGVATFSAQRRARQAANRGHVRTGFRREEARIPLRHQATDAVMFLSRHQRFGPDFTGVSPPVRDLTDWQATVVDDRQLWRMRMEPFVQWSVLLIRRF
ncbi:hypothetical protein [Pseudomonas migulae]|uniref:Uncharacterized protein n=1 Tax=Pseudomonas migulae TaxID=78543 RepID=A0ABY8MQ19_9PSED|nr:hypothetical protein [Pseudomonas migulae]WGK89435.1 hypothetical protein MOQ58_23355 [Pseudomonas migulae]